MSAEEQVRKYFDANTAWFERFGQGRTHGAIHRAVWGEGIRTRAAAFAHIDELILRELDTLEPELRASPHLLDMGCGTAASLIYAARHERVSGTGVTLSPVQAELGTRRIREAGLEARLRCLPASYLAIPSDVPPAALAFSIEAFVLGPDPAAFFAAAAAKLQPGGLLIVVDDFLSERATQPLSAREQRWLDEFRHGWHVSTLITRVHADRLALAAGLHARRDLDLTAQLELRRPRDLLISAAVAIGRHLPIDNPYFRMQLGGNALQMALVNGLIRFHFAVWQREPTPAQERR